ncbi:MAG TPA: S49 family peptidase [Hyphomicrobiaceae bacterium]|nr:S49 family peptidase [Hyphomicrobiaceae bacterium]
MAPTLERAIRGDRVHDAELAELLADDDGEMLAVEDIATYLAAPQIIPAPGRGGKSTALVSVRGIATYDFEYQPRAFSTLHLARTMAALRNDPAIGTVVLDINSPGGMVTGTPEAAEAIFEARDTTRIVALVNPLAASAAYYLASQANEIVAVPTADVGSIGVFMLHADCSGLMEAAGIKPTFIFAGKYKTEGNPFEPLSDEAAAYLQSDVDESYREFVQAVARGRGVSVAKVEADFGQGRTMMAKAAKKAGMVDRVSTLDVALARFGVSYEGVEARRRGEVVADVDMMASSGTEAAETEPTAAGHGVVAFEVDEDDRLALEEVAAVVAVESAVRRRRLSLLTKI